MFMIERAAGGICPIVHIYHLGNFVENKQEEANAYMLGACRRGQQ
jgi:hypothetical protein